MSGIYIFSILWLCLAGYGIYETIKHNTSEDEEDTFFNQLMYMEQFMSPESVARILRVFSFALLAIDIFGFYLTYYYAYEEIGDIYYRITFFFACACVAVIDQTIAMRYTMRISAAIKKLDEKPDVLQRWMSINEPNQNTLNILAAVTKFTIALQLVLFTIFKAF